VLEERARKYHKSTKRNILHPEGRDENDFDY
jgi:hypothetical protein